MFNVWLRTLQLSVKSLWMHPLRSSLTVLGIFIGVSSVIWLLAIGQGIGRAAQEQIASLGALNILVRTIKPSSDVVQDAGYGLTRSDYLRLGVPPGRFLTDADVDEERNYCVLAAEVADELFPVGEPVGHEIMVDDDF